MAALKAKEQTNTAAMKAAVEQTNTAAMKAAMEQTNTAATRPIEANALKV